MQTLILLFHCEDQKGIVARVSDCIFRQEGNIICADQYSTDPEGGHFFLRVEFYTNEHVHSKEQFEDAIRVVAESFKAEWHVYRKEELLRMGVLVSKPDHCLAEILYLVKTEELHVTIPFVISNYEGHKALVEQYGIPFYNIPATADDKKEAEILSLVKEKADFLVLARYMQVLSASFIAQYAQHIINIHHSFLPSFKGANPYQQAFDKGVKVIGATAHFVTEELDEGPIIAQMVEPVSHRDDVVSLVRKGKNLEKRALSQAIHYFIEYRIMQYKNRTIVF